MSKSPKRWVFKNQTTDEQLARPLAGKIAVVTGGGGEIGKSIVHLFVQAGAKVVALDIDSNSLNETQMSALRANDVQCIKTDTSSPSEMKKAFEIVASQYGHLDILVNNAAISIPGTVLDTSIADFEKSMSINVRGYMIGCQEAIPLMRKNGKGSIINIGSVNSYMAERQLFSYCVSKGAVMMLTKSVAYDFAAEEIRCNIICPGWIDTPFNFSHADKLGGVEKIRETMKDWLPIGRSGRPEEIATMALWLASDQSSFATGSAFTIDGGMTVGL
jgi:meso-butanediol dehydrogenase/(S,S)-butanediol dehydrogenase/diacetyl reductase